MSKTLRFLISGNPQDWLPIPLFSALLMVCNLLFPSGSLGDFFQLYLQNSFIVFFFILFVFGSATYTIQLNTALSMGARRKDFFLGSQLQTLLFVAESWVSMVLLARFTLAMGLEQDYGWVTNQIIQNPSNLLPLLLAVLAGQLISLLMRRYHSKKWLGLVFLFLMTTVGCLLGFLSFFINDIQRSGLWGDLFWVLPLLYVVLIVVLDVVLWYIVRRETVR